MKKSDALDIMTEIDPQKLSPWELDFMDSLSNQLDGKLFISDKQVDVLSKIWIRQHHGN